MQPVDLLVHGRWVLPIEPAGAVLQGYGVAVDGGRIVAISPSAALRERYAPTTEINCATHVLMPGFVNAHTHAAMSLLQGAPLRGSVQQWLRESIWPLENRWVSAEFVRVGTQLAIAQMLRAGITTFADMYLFPEEVARLASELRLRIAVGLPVAEARTAWAENADEYLDKGAALWDAHRSDPWASLYFAPHAPYSVSDATLGRLRRISDQLDAPITMHLHETSAEVRESLAAHGHRPLARLAQQGLLRPGFTAIHMNDLDAADIDLCARSGLAVVHCPQSNLRHGSGVSPAAELMGRGVAVALGTDGPASCGTPDVLAEARLASLLAAGLSGQPERIDAHAALGLATLGGARALGLDAHTGSLVAGKSADFIAIDLAQSISAGPQRLADALLQDATRSDVSDVWVAGRRVVFDQELQIMDLAELHDRARQWIARLGLGAAA